MTFPRFMASPLGRGLRISLGLVLVTYGVLARTPVALTLGVVGIVPLASGVFDWCPFSPFFGRDVRR
ncbi:MAG: hypothetical protein PVSMB8_07260 [Vulcanimicrobiaceae bacterium]